MEVPSMLRGESLKRLLQGVVLGVALTVVVHTSLWSRPEAEIRKLSELMPAGQFTVAEAGHYSALESPEAIVPVLMRFLDQNSG